jgi:hypothetical protein
MLLLVEGTNMINRPMLWDEVLHALWRLLTTEQRVALLVLHPGCPGDITLGEIRAIRVERPARREFTSLQNMGYAAADAAARVLVANDREALR